MPPNTVSDEYISAWGLARLAKTQVNVVYALMRRGEIKGTVVNEVTMISREEANRWLTSR